ncbi:hypothetical protein [Burkholderia gladioli]|uniref:hypothetical protein n=1 Tax=Burkholderia gladioli TaxID=28095 RepID=UPI00163EEB75|nr:hypothetical protein [Burkholderia gladioli]
MPRSAKPTPFSLLDGLEPSNNEVIGHRSDDQSQGRSESEGRMRGRASEHAAARCGSSEPSPDCGSRPGGSQDDASAASWEHAIAHVLRDRETAARRASERDSKSWTLHADQQTQNILNAGKERNVTQATAAKYRRAYENLRVEGITALDKATTRSHYDFLRTASHYCMETDVRALRASSERARRAGHLEQAKRLTTEAWKLAAEMDVQFRQPDRKTWKHKAEAMRAAGDPIVSKSKRDTIAPAPSLAVAVLLTTGHHGEKVAERHAERLAVLALFGVRPAELKQGIELSLATNPKTGGQFLAARVKGVKINAERGQAWRTLVVPVDNAAASGLAAVVREHGGPVVVSMTDADHRSLNRALKPSGLSIYSFRHAIGSELKRQAIRKPETAAQAAAFMGHASTKSLASYGRAKHARGGRRFGAKADRKVQSVPVTREQSIDAAAKRAAEQAARAAAAARVPTREALSRRVQTPGKRSRSGPKPSWAR